MDLVNFLTNHRSGLAREIGAYARQIGGRGARPNSRLMCWADALAG